MDYFTLNENLQLDQLIQGYESIVWTERYSAFGDFQIVTKSTQASRAFYSDGQWITRGGSNYIMIVDTIQDQTDQDGVRKLTITGKSLEALLLDRVAMPGFADTTTVPNWTLTGTPRTIMQEAFDTVCVRCVFSLGDSIPYYTFGTLLPTGNLPEPSDIIVVSAQPGTLYDLIKQIADTYLMGFRLVKEGETGRIYFEIYMGNDLTRGQTVYTPVIFDPDLGTLSQISWLTSSAALKHVAYVFAANGTAIAYAPGADPSSAGRDRRVLLVNSSNSDPAGDGLTQALQAEGQIALAGQRQVYAFDGQLPPSSGYIYGVDYNLGDQVEENNEEHQGNLMIVTEQIFAADNTGETSYPTLALLNTIVPDSWLDYEPATQSWNDVDPSLTWNDE